MAKKINIIANLIDKQFRKQLRDIENGKYKINVDVDNEKISKTSNHINQVRSSAASTNTTFGKLKSTISDTFSTGRISMTMFLAVLNEIRKAGKNAKQTIEEIDEAITNLSIATNMTREATAGLVKDYNNYAKELKSTTTQVTSAADDYLRAGKSMSEAKDLIKDSIMLSKLGQIDSATATEDILATMNGYEMSIEEVGRALDAMVAIDMEAATSAGDLVTGLKYSAASASSAELSFNKLVAILGTVQDKTQQSAEIVGTFANTMLSRYRDVTIGKYLTDDGEDISNYESVLKSVGIALRDEHGEFIDFEAVLQEMADKWETLSSSQQNALIKVGAGTRQANRFIALMEGYDKVLELTEVAANSAGTAVEKFNNSYTNSLEAKQNTLQASFESMIINSDFDEVYSGIIEATTALVDFMNQTNALKGIMAGLTISTGIKFFLAIKSGANEAYISLNKFANALKIAKQTNISTDDFDKLLVLSKGLSASQMKLIVSTNALSVSQKKELLVASGLSEEEAILQLQTWKMTTAQTGLTAATTSLGNAFKGLFATLIANPITLIVMAISGAVMAFQSYNQKVEEMRQRVKESANEAKTLSSEVSELTNKYIELSEAVKTDANAKEDLLSTQTELLKKLGLEGESVDDLVAKYGNLSNAIRQASIDSLRQSRIDLLAGLDIAKEELLKAGKDGFWGGNNIINATGEDAVKAFKILEQAGIIGKGAYGSEGGSLVLTGDDKTVDGILENYQKLKSAIEELQKSDAFTSEELSENSLFSAMYDRYSELRDEVEEYNSSIESINESIAQEIMQTALLGNEFPKTQEQFEAFKQEMIDTAIASKQFIGNEDEIAATMSNFLASVPQFAGFYSIPLEEELDKVDTMLEEKTFSYDKLSDIPQKLAEVENAYKTAQEALDSYNEKGYYSMDVIDSILSLEDEYINVLVDQNGQLQINESSMNQLAKIKIEAAKASIYQETCEELVRIKTLDTSLAAQELALVNGTLTESAYETARALYEEVQAMGGANAALANNVWDSATKKVKLLDNQLKSLNSGSYNVGKSAISDSAKKATKDAEKATKEYIDSYMDYMEKSLESGRIDYQTYSRDVAKFLKDMYDQGKIAAKDYHDYTKEMLTIQKSIYESALKAITGRLDKEIQKFEDLIDGVEKANDELAKQKSIMENAADAVVDYIDSLIDGEDKAIDALNEANDSISKQIDKYDSLVNVADRLYESEQNRLKDEQDAIQEKIDLINDENSAYDLQYRKEQALYELQRSQQQRTKKVYVGGNKGYIYQTDKAAISEAKKNVEDIKTEELINSLKKEKEALQDSIDVLQEYKDALSDISNAYQKLVDERNAIELIGEDYEDIILGMNINDWILLKNKYISANEEMADNKNLIKSHDEKIKIWEEEKRKWGNLSSVIDTEAKKQAASQQFGANWEKQINNGRLVSFDEFKSKYLNIESQINDNTKLINSYNEKIEYYENLKDQWNSLADEYENSVEDQYAAMLMGQNWEADVLSGRLDKLNDFRNQYISIQQAIADAAWASANEQIKAAQEAEKAAQGNIGSSDKIGGNPQTIQEYQIIDTVTGKTIYTSKSEGNASQKLASLNAYELDSGRYYIKKKYASGTTNAKKGLNLVGEDGIETFIDNEGNISLVTEPTLIPMEGGEIVKNESETKSLLDGSNLIPLQTSDLFKKLSVNMPDLSSMFKTNIPDYSNLVMRNNNVQQPSIVIGDIHLHEVQSVDGLANAIIRELPNRVTQALSKR